MNNGYYASIGNFMEQVNAQLRNSDDVITSIGVWSGTDRAYLYTVYCTQANGTKYEINIMENWRYDLDIKVNISEEDYNRLICHLNTKGWIVNNTYGCITVNDKISFDLITDNTDNESYNFLQIDVYDIKDRTTTGLISYCEEISDRFPTAEIQDCLDLCHGYEAFKKSAENAVRKYMSCDLF